MDCKRFRNTIFVKLLSVLIAVSFLFTSLDVIPLLAQAQDASYVQKLSIPLISEVLDNPEYFESRHIRTDVLQGLISIYRKHLYGKDVDLDRLNEDLTNLFKNKKDKLKDEPGALEALSYGGVEFAAQEWDGKLLQVTATYRLKNNPHKTYLARYANGELTFLEEPEEEIRPAKHAIPRPREDLSGRIIVDLEEVTIDDVPIVGGKGANLGELLKLSKKSPEEIAELLREAGLSEEVINKFIKGHPDGIVNIPPGFVVTTKAYRRFLDENSGLREYIDKQLKGLDPNDSDALASAGKNIRERILSSEMPSDIRKEIEKSYKEFCERLGIPNVKVAVRSSATAEDTQEAAFAGQQATYLNVSGIEDVLEKVKHDWASLFTDRAIFYRHTNAVDHMKAELAVVVQQMAQRKRTSEVKSAGIAFSVDTETGWRPIPGVVSGVVGIDMGVGLGEGAVSGLQTPDAYLVAVNPFGELVILDKELGSKLKKVVYDREKGGTKEVDTTQDERDNFTQPDDKVIDLATTVLLIQQHYKKRLIDVEYAVDSDGELFITQTRPETVYAKRRAEIIPMEIKVVDEKDLKDAKLILRGTRSSSAASGRVVIVDAKTSEELSRQLAKVKKGDILVAPMTTPDMVPAMKRAAAIVTNEGGSRSHAAIVGRELGIPVVLGTSTATITLKEGQIVTVDANRGEVYEGALPLKIAGEDFIVRRPPRLVRALEQLKDEATLTDVNASLAKLDSAGYFRELVGSLDSVLTEDFLKKVTREHPEIIGNKYTAGLMRHIIERINSGRTHYATFLKVIGNIKGNLYLPEDIARGLADIIRDSKLPEPLKDLLISVFEDRYLSRDFMNALASIIKAEPQEIKIPLLKRFTASVEKNYLPETKTKIGEIIANPAGARRMGALSMYPSMYGVSLMRAEFALADIGVHPLALFEYDANGLQSERAYKLVRAIVEKSLDMSIVNEIVDKTGRLEEEVKEDIIKKEVEKKLEELRKRIENQIKGYKSAHDFYVSKLSTAIAGVAATLSQDQTMIFRTTDFKTNEYKELIGGEMFEGIERNPMMGYRGLGRMLSGEYTGAFEWELQAIKKARDMGYHNVAIMFPVVRTPKELDMGLKVLKEHGLERGKDGLKVGIMVEVPSCVFQAMEFYKRPIDFMSIGSNDLTQFILAVGRDNEKLEKIFDEANPALLRALEIVIKLGRRAGIKTGFCGQRPSNDPSFAEKLVTFGIDSIGAAPSSYKKVADVVALTEEKLAKEARLADDSILGLLDLERGYPDRVKIHEISSGAIIQKIGVHPLAYDKDNKNAYEEAVYRSIMERLKEASDDELVVFGTNDLEIPEYLKLKEGASREGKDANPAMGFTGLARVTGQEYREIFDIELKALKRAIQDSGKKGRKNIGIKLNLVRTEEEIERALAAIKEAGLNPGEDIKVGLSVDTAANVLIIDRLMEKGMNFVYFNEDKLGQYILAADQLNERELVKDEEIENALRVPFNIVTNFAQKYKVKLATYGEAKEFPKPSKQVDADSAKVKSSEPSEALPSELDELLGKIANLPELKNALKGSPEDNIAELQKLVLKTNEDEYYYKRGEAPLAVQLKGEFGRLFGLKDDDLPLYYTITASGDLKLGKLYPSKEATDLARDMDFKRFAGEIPFEGGKTVFFIDGENYIAVTAVYGDKELFEKGWVLAKGGLRMIERKGSGTTKEDIWKAVEGFVKAFLDLGTLGVTNLLGPDMRPNPSISVDEVMGWIDEIGLKAIEDLDLRRKLYPLTTSGPSKEGFLSHDEWRVTSITDLESICALLEDEEFLRKAGLTKEGEKTIIIQGFGEVGSNIIRVLWEEREKYVKYNFKIVGISDLDFGALYNEKGFSLEMLYNFAEALAVARKDKRGINLGDFFDLSHDRFQTPEQIVEKPNEILFKGATILIPSAKGYVIRDEEDARRLKASGVKIIGPTANIIFGKEGSSPDEVKELEEYIHSLGIYSIPSWLINYGGIGLSKEEIIHRLIEAEKYNGDLKKALDEMKDTKKREWLKRHILGGDIYDIAWVNMFWALHLWKKEGYASPLSEIMKKRAFRILKEYKEDLLRDKEAPADLLKRLLRKETAITTAKSRLLIEDLADDIGEFIEALSKKDKPIEIRRVAAYVLGRSGNKAHIDGLLKIIEDDEAKGIMWRNASTGLGYLLGELEDKDKSEALAKVIPSLQKILERLVDVKPEEGDKYERKIWIEWILKRTGYLVEEGGKKTLITFIAGGAGYAGTEELRKLKEKLEKLKAQRNEMSKIPGVSTAAESEGIRALEERIKQLQSDMPMMGNAPIVITPQEALSKITEETRKLADLEKALAENRIWVIMRDDFKLDYSNKEAADAYQSNMIQALRKSDNISLVQDRDELLHVMEEKLGEKYRVVVIDDDSGDSIADADLSRFDGFRDSYAVIQAQVKRELNIGEFQCFNLKAMVGLGIAILDKDKERMKGLFKLLTGEDIEKIIAEDKLEELFKGITRIIKLLPKIIPLSPDMESSRLMREFIKTAA